MVTSRNALRKSIQRSIAWKRKVKEAAEKAAAEVEAAKLAETAGSTRLAEERRSESAA